MRISVEEVARRLGIHPFEVVRHLTTHRQSMPGFTVESDMVSTVMGWAGLENWWEDDPSDAISSARGDLSTSRGVDASSPRHDPHIRRRVVRWIPYKLLQKGKVGASHTRIDNAWRGLSGDMKGFGKNVVDRMKRDGILLTKPTVNGEHIFLNPERLEDIQRLIDWADPPRAYRQLVGE